MSPATLAMVSLIFQKTPKLLNSGGHLFEGKGITTEQVEIGSEADGYAKGMGKGTYLLL